MKIAIASDHAAIQLKSDIVEWLKENGYEVNEYGSFENEKLSYVDAADLVCKDIQNNTADYGILICGTGIGMSMCANKHKGIRAACCSDYFSAKFTRAHNDANVLTFGARVVGRGLAIELVNVFLHTSFEGGRHAERVNHMMELEKDW